jgi:hypothetical protein
MDKYQKKIIDEYYQKISIFAILCSKASKYYTFYKNMLILPNILIGSILTILNSIFNNTNDIKYANITLNALSTLLITLDKSFQFSEKSASFLKSSISFTTLSHAIDKFYVNPHGSNKEDITNFINMLITDYDKLIESLSYEIPSSIIENVISQFGNDIKIPLVMLTSSNANINHFQKSRMQSVFIPPIFNSGDNKIQSAEEMENRNKTKPRSSSIDVQYINNDGDVDNSDGCED